MSIRLSSVRIHSTSSGRCIISPSVISRRSERVLMPVSRSVPATSSMSSFCPSLRPETFTLIVSGGSSARFVFHSCTWRAASRIIHWSSGTIRPLETATGMNAAGETKPRVGLIQRTSASKPVMRPVLSETIGWKYVRNSPPASAARSSVSICCAAAACSCIFGSNSTCDAPPCCRARWTARYASRSSSSAAV